LISEAVRRDRVERFAGVSLAESAAFSATSRAETVCEDNDILAPGLS